MSGGGFLLFFFIRNSQNQMRQYVGVISSTLISKNNESFHGDTYYILYNNEHNLIIYFLQGVRVRQ